MIARTATRVVDVKTAVRSIEFSRDGQVVLVREDGDGDAPDSLALFDVRAGMDLNRVSSRDLGVGHTVRPISRHIFHHLAHTKRKQIKDIKFNHTRQLVYVAGDTGELAILDYPSLKLLHQIDAHLHEATTIGVDIRGCYVATGGADALVNLWEPQEWICQRSIPNAEYVY